ncbi:MAG: PLP-dependent aminotransferase family protein [Planctomycetes bacterium]|nr:PLP-dependent aminotransferase family protein [Planctomycetota bacterium]
MLGIYVDRKSGMPLARQIHRRLCDLITASRLRAGDALPSTRGLAAYLKVSRNTVNEAYAMLWAEGFIVGRQGSGYTVAEGIILPKPAAAAAPPPALPACPVRYDFRTGVPDLDRFPFRAWARYQRRVLESVRPRDMHYGDCGGYPPLRTAVADWLLRSRGLAVDPEAVHITAGATHALSLAVDVTGRGGGHFIVENPCHIGIVTMLRLKRVSFSWLPVDELGLRIGPPGRRSPIGVYVTPSHQFPLGHVLSAGRRTRLIALARKRNFYVIEDDYDSEFRYDGPALTPLHSLDPDRVIYVGTFSKTLFPALRIGFAVVPPALRQTWNEFRRYSDVQNAIGDQAVLARFIEEGGLNRHIKNMTRAYGLKRTALVAAVQARFGDDSRVIGDSAGLHLALKLPGQSFDRNFADTCRRVGLAVMPCSRYELAGTEYADTLLLGYGNVEPDRIADGVALLAKAVAEHRAGTRR